MENYQTICGIRWNLPQQSVNLWGERFWDYANILFLLKICPLILGFISGSCPQQIVCFSVPRINFFCPHIFYICSLNSSVRDLLLFIYLFVLSFLYTSIDTWAYFILLAITYTNTVIIFLSFLFSSMPCNLQDLSSLTRDRTVPPTVGPQNPNRWTIREFLLFFFFLNQSSFGYRELPGWLLCLLTCSILKKKKSLLNILALLLLRHFSRVRLCATPLTAHQAPLSLGFSRQEHWSGLPFPSPMHESEKWKWSCSVASDSVRPHR